MKRECNFSLDLTQMLPMSKQGGDHKLNFLLRNAVKSTYIQKRSRGSKLHTYLVIFLFCMQWWREKNNSNVKNKQHNWKYTFKNLSTFFVLGFNYWWSLRTFIKPTSTSPSLYLRDYNTRYEIMVLFLLLMNVCKIEVL